MEAQYLPCPEIARGQQRLLPEQEAYVHLFFTERRAALCSCVPINEQEAEEHLSSAYGVLGLDRPRVRWFDSPQAFLVAYALQWVSNAYGTEIGKHIHARIEALAEDVLLGIWNGASDTIWDQVEGGIPAGDAWDSMLHTIWMRVYEEIREKRVREDDWWVDRWPKSGKNDTWEKVQEKLETDRFWRNDAQYLIRAYREEGRLACFRFFHEVFEENPLIHLARLNELVSGYCLGETAAWLIRKPVRMERDEQGRLHSADGMCIQYLDGLGLHAWHGVRCPERYMLGNITRADWLREENLERRRVIEERLGSEHFIALVGGRCIHQSRRGKLIEIDLGADPERVAHYLQVRDPSTNRQYYLRVPPSLANTDEAVAWTFGLDAATYQPDQET